MIRLSRDSTREINEAIHFDNRMLRQDPDRRPEGVHSDKPGTGIHGRRRGNGQRPV
ncbi:MAG: hypothetical protein OXC42_00440 [Gammaproteobacteria bacterium]|nr:hypothetical protein [Gammaproteobacteria bacterium]